MIVENRVQEVIEHFYEVALQLHPALDEITVEKKKDRLYAALDILSRFPRMYSTARYNQEWIAKKYRVLVCEDFLFAYNIYYDAEIDEYFVVVHDAVHSLLYHD